MLLIRCEFGCKALSFLTKFKCRGRKSGFPSENSGFWDKMLTFALTNLACFPLGQITLRDIL